MRVVVGLLLAVTAAVWHSALLFADTAEDVSTTQTDVTRSQSIDDAKLDVDHTKPAQVNYNFTQPDTPERPVDSRQPVALWPLASSSAANAASAGTAKNLTLRKVRKVHSRERPESAKRSRTKRNSDQARLKLLGNERVIAFRDCLSAFAAQRAIPDTPDAPRLLISRVMDEECRKPFDAMASEIIKRYGKARFEDTSERLISEILLPAIADYTSVAGTEAKAAGGG